MLAPSFYALYKQGRFRRRSLDTANEEVMQQRERFAVALLAFALQHDLDFRKSFLQQVCEYRGEVNAGEFLVELEVFGCGDLILRKADDSEVYVLEFKVAANLQDDQNPFKQEFLARGGYGANIKKAYPMERTYIVLQKERQVFPDFLQKEMRCLGKSWRDVFDCPHDALLISDLFESFGALEIPEFIRMKTKHTENLPPLGRTAFDAAKLFQLLANVALEVGFKTEVDSKFDSGDKASYVGLACSLSRSLTTRWKALIQPPDKWFGWFGYVYRHQQRTTQLEVWFYCGSPKAAGRTRKALKKGFPATETDGGYAWISLPAEESSGDQQWFISVFDALVPRK